MATEYFKQFTTSAQLSGWWSTHRALTLRELQIEALQWRIDQETRAGFATEQEQAEILTPLQRALAALPP